MTLTFKDSAILGVTSIPSHWNTAKLSRVATNLDGRRVPVSSELRTPGSYPYYGATQQVGTIDSYLFDGEYVLLGEDGVDFLDPKRPKAYLATGKFWVNNHAHVYLAKGELIHSRYLLHSLNCLSYAGVVGGATRLKLTKSSAQALLLPLPPLEEQQRIVRFLDRETAKIDGAVRELEATLALLDEQQQILISEVVTHGIPGVHAEFKDSGAPWLGKIPTEWETPLLNHLVSPRKRLNTGLVNQNLLSLSYGNVVQKAIQGATGLVPESYEGYQIIKPKEVVFRFTDMQNDHRSMRSAISGHEGIMSPAYLVVEVENQRVEPEYFAFVMRAFDIRKLFYGLGGGLRQAVSYKDISKLRIPLPPKAEQKEIVAYLQKRSADQDDLRAEIKDTIGLLKEKRSALIREVVTGQLVVE